MNINDHRDDFADFFRDWFSNGDELGREELLNDADYLLASPALARLLAAARDEARAEALRGAAPACNCEDDWQFLNDRADHIARGGTR